MLKKETFNLEESNVAALGGAEDKAARLAAAQTEKAWEKAGKQPGLQIWRIEKFKVKISKTPAGTFYSDDSYICLNTYKEEDSEKLKYDVHFWLGKTTSQDEAGTAAYKTVELDDLLGGDPIQHREVEGHESPLFLSYFTEVGGIRLLEGGVESGFNHVKPETYKPRLLHLKGRKNIRIEEVPIDPASMNSGDVFIFDAGLNIYQWQGKSAGMNEKARAGQLCRAIDDERKGKPEVHVFAQGDKDEIDFFKAMGLEAVPEISGEVSDDAEWEKQSNKELWQLSDKTGTLVFNKVADTKVPRSLLDTKDVFVFDIGSEVYVWVGLKASEGERRNAMQFAGKYLKDQGRPAFLPITRVLEGGDNKIFESSFDKE
jgi:gelsolin